jgi:hypothetical protein
MGILQRASGAVKSIDLGEGDYLKVKQDISKRDFNFLLQAMPNREITKDNGLTIQEGAQFAESLFDLLVEGWSLSEGKPSVTDYLELTPQASSKVDEVLINHFNDITPKVDEQSKVTTSQGSRRKATTPTR